MNRIPQKLLTVGSIGLVIVVLLNGYAFFVKAQPAAVLFSGYWWASWFPAYLIWLVFIVAGLRGRSRAQGGPEG